MAARRATMLTVLSSTSVLASPSAMEMEQVMKVRSGWCPNWNHGNAGDTRYYGRNPRHDWNRDAASCFAKCDNSTACNQAVFETESSPWGAACWLGTNDMYDLPARPSRPCAERRDSMVRPGRPCTDFCYAKNGWVTPTLQVQPGWCPNWRIGAEGDRHYFGRHHATLWNEDAESCFRRCDESPGCAQAVFETRDSAFGAQCFLGLNNMTLDPSRQAVPRASRACAHVRPSMVNPGSPCVDYCYAKHGFIEVAAGDVASQDTEQADIDATIDATLGKLAAEVAKPPPQQHTRLDRLARQLEAKVRALQADAEPLYEPGEAVPDSLAAANVAKTSLSNDSQPLFDGGTTYEPADTIEPNFHYDHPLP